MAISRESAEVTGIRDADVAGVAPPWEDVAAEWRDFLEGCVLHGYNAKRFDVPLLRAEFARAGIDDFPPLGCAVVDSQRIFFRREPRTLAAALRFYCGGRALEGAHSALADSRAALDVLCAQVARYGGDVGGDGGSNSGDCLPASPEALAAWCSAPDDAGDATWDGRFKWRGRKGEQLVFGFGALDGVPVAAAAVEERDTLLWLRQQDLSDEALIIVTDALAGVRHTRASLAARLAAAAAAGRAGTRAVGDGAGGGGGSRAE